MVELMASIVGAGPLRVNVMCACVTGGLCQNQKSISSASVSLILS